MVVSLHRLGDTVFTIPAVMEIQKHFKKRITIVCFPDSVPIYKLVFDEVNFCVLQPGDFYLGGRMASSSARRRLKAMTPKIIFDLTCSMVSASLIFNLKAKRKIGSNGYQFRKIYDEFVEVRKSPQLTDIYLDAISPIINLSNRAEIKKQPRVFNSNGRILIQPFAGWTEKEWGLKKFIILVDKLKDDYPISLIIQSGQIDKDVLEEIKKSTINLIQTKSVEELINLIKGCSLFIGNDSGPVNLANFFGKPTLTIYGSTNPDYTTTKAKHQIYVQETLNCSAKKDEKFCIIGLATYNCSGIQCMNLLSIEKVYERLIPLMGQYCERNNLV